MKKLKAITIALAAVGVGSMCGLVYANIAPYDESKCINDYCEATTTTYSGFVEWPSESIKPRLYKTETLKQLGSSVSGEGAINELENQRVQAIKDKEKLEDENCKCSDSIARDFMKIFSVDDLNALGKNTSRGIGGFGSTDKKTM